MPPLSHPASIVRRLLGTEVDLEPFYRAGTPGGEHRGSGLGLAIARGFSEANAGSLHVESLPGQGATFVFELPLKES